jgi:multidrug efflux pump subunit AcrB
MNADVFPNIAIPVVMVVWNYPGLSAQERERRVVLISEHACCSASVRGCRLRCAPES